MTQNTATIVAGVLSPILTIATASAIAWWSKRKAKLVWYTLPSQIMYLPNDEGPPRHSEMGALFLENRSDRVLANVTVAHMAGTTFYYLVQQPIEMYVRQLESNSEALVFPRLPAGSSLTILYTFTQPMAGSVIRRIFSDEGEGRLLPFLLQQQRPAWQRRAIICLAFIGAWSMIYIFIRVALLIAALRSLLL